MVLPGKGLPAQAIDLLSATHGECLDNMMSIADSGVRSSDLGFDLTKMIKVVLLSHRTVRDSNSHHSDRSDYGHHGAAGGAAEAYSL